MCGNVTLANKPDFDTTSVSVTIEFSTSTEHHMPRWRKAFRPGWAFVFAAAGLGLLWLYGASPATDVATLEMQDVRHTVQALGPRQATLGLHLPESASFDLPRLDEIPPPLDEALWAYSALPDGQARPPLLRNEQTRDLSIRWYRFDVDTAAAPQTPWAVGIERVVGGPVTVWGRSTATAHQWQLLHDNRSAWLTQWNRPILVNLPPEWGPDSATLQVAVGIPTLSGINFGITPIRVGPATALKWWHRKAMFWRTTVPLLISVCALLLGWFSITLGRSITTQRSFYLFGFLTLVWAVRNLHYYVPPPQTRLAYEWFWWLTNASLSWVMVLSQIFILRIGQLSWARTERLLLVFATTISVVTLPIFPLLAEVLVLQHLLNVAVAVMVCGMTLWSAHRVGNAEFRWLAFTLLLGTVFGVHDWLLVSGRLMPDRLYLLPFGCLFLVVIFQNVLANQHIRTLRALGVANDQQQRLLEAQRLELDRQYQMLSAIASERAIADERKRLMRDMHDGLGASLLSSMAIVQSDPNAPEILVQSISDCMTELRSVIDSLEPIEEDVGALLGKLRHRIGPSLERNGTVVRWQVDELPRLQWLNASHTLQLMRLLKEMFGNIIKHAQARHIDVVAQARNGQLVLEIKDDGVGFDPQSNAASMGRGLQNMRTRSEALGATLELHTAHGEGVHWILALPLSPTKIDTT